MLKLDALRPFLFASAAALAVAGSGCAADLDPAPELGDPSPDVGGVTGAEKGESEVPGTISEPPRPDAEATVMAADLAAPGQTFVVGESLYWVDVTAEGALLSTMPIDGGEPVVVAKLDEVPFDGAVFDSAIYLTAPRNQELLVGKAGGAEAFAQTGERPLAVAIDGGYAYWSSVEGCIQRTTLGGGTTEKLACGEGAALSIAIAANRVVWSTSDGYLYSTALEPTETVDVLASGEVFNAPITADDHRVFWASHGERQLRSVDVERGAIEIIGRAQYDVSGLSHGDGYVYFTTHSDGSVKRIPVEGGRAEVVVAGQADPSYLTQNDEFLFWANEGDGTIARISKW